MIYFIWKLSSPQNQAKNSETFFHFFFFVVFSIEIETGGKGILIYQTYVILVRNILERNILLLLEFRIEGPGRLLNSEKKSTRDMLIPATPFI